MLFRKEKIDIETFIFVHDQKIILNYIKSNRLNNLVILKCNPFEDYKLN